MNLYQLTYVSSPVVGAVAGGTTGARHGVKGIVAGAGIGLVSGLLMDFCALAFTAWVRKLSGVNEHRPPEGIVPTAVAGFVGKFLPMITPIFAALLSLVLVRAVFK
jgi:hypothetical protein